MSSPHAALLPGSSIPTFALCLALGLLALLAGCGPSKFLSVRRVPKSPLEGPLQLVSYKGPQPSDRTEQILRRYALDERQKKSPQQVLISLHEEMAKDPSPEKVYSFSELAFISAKRAEHKGDDAQALDCYAASVAHAYLYLFSPHFDGFAIPTIPSSAGPAISTTGPWKARCGWPQAGQAATGQVAGDHHGQAAVPRRTSWCSGPWQAGGYRSWSSSATMKFRAASRTSTTPMASACR